MLRIVGLVSGLGWHVQDLLRAAGQLGIAFHPLPFPTIEGYIGNHGSRLEAGGIALKECDGVLVRMMPPGTLEQVGFRMDAFHSLTGTGTTVLTRPAST